MDARHVLLVDDDAAVLRSLRSYLNRVGYETHAATSVREALAQAAAEPSIEAVVSDLSLPDASGVDLAKQLAVAHPHLKVILMSGFAAPEASNGDLADHCDAFLAKPLSVTSLVDTLAALLDASGVEQG